MTYTLTTGETTTPLSDGGRVVALPTTFHGLSVLEAQKFDSAGNSVGGPLQIPPNPFELFEYFTGQYLVAPDAEGGYLVVTQFLGHAYRGQVDVVGADGTSVGQASVPADNLGLTLGSDGGFVMSGLRAGVYGAPTDQPVVQLFDKSAHPLSTTVMLAGQISAITPETGGDFAVQWDDAGVARTLTLDPAAAANLTTPAAPSAVVIDSSGLPAPPLGTSDRFPTLRVSVDQPGEVFVWYPAFHSGSGGGGIPLTSEDLARGYIDIPITVPPGAVSLGYVRVADTNGVASAQVVFGVNETPPSGVVLYGKAGDVLQGTALDDVFNAAFQGSETLSGGAGADVFVFSQLPWTPDVITDFTAGQDTLYLRGLFPQYAGLDPIGTGYVTLISDGAGGTDVLVNPDGRPSAANPWPTFVAELKGVAPGELTGAALFGGAAGAASGQVFDGGYQDSLVGTSGADTFNASVAGSETLTGGAGADTFVFSQLPWTPDRITDFAPGQDRLDLRALFPGYTGADPIGGGYVTLIPDGAGGTDVLVNPDGRATAANPWPTFVVDLVGVSPTALTSDALFGGPIPPAPGQIFTGAYADVLSGSDGSDTFVASVQGSETLSGGAGADIYQFSRLPWTPDRITDFAPSQDRLDLHALYPGYAGHDPVGAGYVTLISDGAGGTDVLVNPDGHATAANPWPTFVADLVGVSPEQLASASWLV